jgi:uncharacterized protein (DUF1919 family)
MVNVAKASINFRNKSSIEQAKKEYHLRDHTINWLENIFK